LAEKIHQKWGDIRINLLQDWDWEQVSGICLIRDVMNSSNEVFSRYTGETRKAGSCFNTAGAPPVVLQTEATLLLLNCGATHGI
jgi:hypothetical protein